jgi:hypothetical protein
VTPALRRIDEERQSEPPAWRCPFATNALVCAGRLDDVHRDVEEVPPQLD